MSEQQAVWRTAERPDLRNGVWTRLGDQSVLGDQATEAVLGALAERARDAARAQGYSVGWSEGHQTGLRRAAEEAELVRQAAARREEQREAEHAAAVAALTSAARALSASTARVADRVAAQATELAFELTRTLVGHELSLATDPGVDTVQRVLAVLPRNTTTVVRLHPRTAMSGAVDELLELGTEVVPDHTLDPHDAVVETATTAIDLRIGEALERIREALS